MQDLCNLVQKDKGWWGFPTWQPPTHSQQKLCAELEKHSETHDILFIIQDNPIVLFTPKNKICINTMST